MVATILRKFNDFKGKQRLSRLLLNSAIRNHKDFIVEGKYGCKYKIPNLKEVIGFELYINGIFEEEYVKLIQLRLPTNGVFIDLGANIGSIMVPVCKSRPDVKAFAVEASSAMVDYLETNLYINGISNCAIEHKAVWNVSDRELSFYIPEEQYGKGMVAISPMASTIEKVTTISIDDLCKKYCLDTVDFIKVDIEGFEYFAFRGGVQLLKKENAPDILFEFIASSEKAADHLEPGDAQSILMSYGYRLYTIESAQLVPMVKPMTKSYAMIFASKKIS